MIEWLDSPTAKAISLVSAILGIIAFFQIKKVVVKNRLKNTQVGGNFVGRKGKAGSELHVQNDLKNSKIKGDFTGSDES